MSTTLTRSTFERTGITSRPSPNPPTPHGASALPGSRIPTAPRDAGPVAIPIGEAEPRTHPVRGPVVSRSASGDWLSSAKMAALVDKGPGRAAGSEHTDSRGGAHRHRARRCSALLSRRSRAAGRRTTGAGHGDDRIQEPSSPLAEDLSRCTRNALPAGYRGRIDRTGRSRWCRRCCRSGRARVGDRTTLAH